MSRAIGLYSSGLEALMRKRLPSRIGQSIEELERETRITWWAFGGILSLAVIIDLTRNGYLWNSK